METERAYLAGIVDGEGTITLTRTHRNRTASPQLSISSTCFDLLDYVRCVTGCGHVTSKKKSLPHHRQSWHWQIHSAGNVLRILRDIRPFLRIKAAQADLILSHYKDLTPGNGRYSPELLEKKTRLVEIVQRLNREQIYVPHNTPDSIEGWMKI